MAFWISIVLNEFINFYREIYLKRNKLKLLIKYGKDKTLLTSVKCWHVASSLSLLYILLDTNQRIRAIIRTKVSKVIAPVLVKGQIVKLPGGNTGSPIFI